MSTVAALKEVLAAVKGDPGLAANLPDDASVLDDVDLDSLELLQFMLEIEAGLSVQIDFEQLDYEHLRSLTTLAEFLDAMPPSPAQASGGGDPERDLGAR